MGGYVVKSDRPYGIWDGDDTELELRRAGHDLDIHHVSEEYPEKRSWLSVTAGSEKLAGARSVRR